MFACEQQRGLATSKARVPFQTWRRAQGQGLRDRLHVGQGTLNAALHCIKQKLEPLQVCNTTIAPL